MQAIDDQHELGALHVRVVIRHFEILITEETLKVDTDEELNYSAFDQHHEHIIREQRTDTTPPGNLHHAFS